MKNIFLALFFLIKLHATVLTPILSIESNGTTKDMVLEDNTLIIGTDNGILEVYNYEEKKVIKTIVLAKVKDFVGDDIPAVVFSVDKIDTSYLLLSDSGKNGYVSLWIEQNGVLREVLTAKDKLVAIKARFIDKEHVLLGLLSNEALLLNLKTKQKLYKVQLSESKFSDFALNEDKSQAVFSCESGVLNVINTKSGKVIKILKSLNVDNVFSVDFKKEIVSAGGKDRRASIYDVLTAKGSYIKSTFFIYATGLSPSAKRVAFAMDEQNNISIYNRESKVKIAELKGQKSTLNRIIFKDENILFSSSNDSTILMWNLNKEEK